jgi:hypothetical protein
MEILSGDLTAADNDPDVNAELAHLEREAAHRVSRG